MTFYPEPYPVPVELKTPQFTLRPLMPTHVELDFAALMDSKQMLRLWSGSPWPTDNFTLENNLEDLEWHFMEQQDRIAFTYTVLSPDETECLGCIYINSMQKFQNQIPAQLNPITNLDATTRFWIREPYLADHLDRQLLNVLIDWFDTDWQFNRHFFHTRSVHEQQIQLFEKSRLRKRFALDLPSRGGRFFFYA